MTDLESHIWNWSHYLNSTRIVPSIFYISADPPVPHPQSRVSWVTCNSPSHSKPEVEILPLRYNTKSSFPCISSEQEEKRPDYYVHKMMDRTYILPYLANSSIYCAYHLPMTEMQRLTEVKRQFNFDHTAFLIYIWIILWVHQMNFWPKKKDQGQNTLRLNLKVLPLLACHALQFTVSLFKVKMKIGAWSIYIWTKRGEADYECSKCNFYYTSIILLLITDSFSLHSSSKTHSYSIHMHTGGDKEIGEAIWNV